MAEEHPRTRPSRLGDGIRRATAAGGTCDIAFAPNGCGHRMSIGPDGVFVITPCSRSEVNEVQARKVIAALTGWLESR